MSDVGEISARRTVMDARIPEDRLIRDDGQVFAVPDQVMNCHLREGHRVQFVVTVENIQDDVPVIEELYCADPGCEYHSYKPVNENVSVDTEQSRIGDLEQFEDKDGVYIGEGYLVTDYESEPTMVTLTDISLETYAEEMELEKIAF